MRDKKEFYSILQGVDGRSYGEYARIVGDFDFARYVLKISQIQPEGTDTLFVVRVPQIIAAFPPHTFNSPVRRTALEDTELGGQTIRKGEKIVMWYISANRDERVFPDAERFDVGRSNARRHLGFGHGIHRCVGAKLAENQLATLIEEIVSRQIRIVPQGTPERLPSPFLHGFTQMPVRIEPL